MGPTDFSASVPRFGHVSWLAAITGLMLNLAATHAEAEHIPFGPQRVINLADPDAEPSNETNGNADGAVSVLAADIDGDGDLDVLSASFRDNKIAWYQNTDSLGAFGPQQVITNLADFANSVFAADLDGDGDPDVLSASQKDNKIAWYQNTDGLGAFGPQQVISTSANGAVSVFAADLDGDGDLDVLSASFGDDKIAWYENSPPPPNAVPHWEIYD